MTFFSACTTNKITFSIRVLDFSLIIQNHLKVILFFPYFCNLRSWACHLLKNNLTVNLSHLASSFATCGTGIHPEKGCREFWTHTGSKLRVLAIPKGVSPRSIKKVCPVCMGQIAWRHKFAIWRSCRPVRRKN